jgi:murein DD-endopeptidase MepM/ murein hydrolase activator NlpD
MATNPIVGALPTAIPPGITGDQTAQQEYMSALDKVVESLEKRNQINYFNVAGQFFDPGRTGSFGEAAGRASTAMGKEIEAQQAAAPSIALMRAQLAGQKYTLQNDAKALNIIADNLGIEPQNTQQALMKGDLTPTQIAKIPQLYPIIATLSPSRAEMLKNMHGMLVESNKVGAEIGKGTMDAVKIVLETPGALPLLPKMFTQGIPGQAAQTTQTVPQGLGFSPPAKDAVISSPFGQRTDPVDRTKTAMHNGIDFAAPNGSPVQAVLPGEVKFVGPKGGFGNTIEIQHKDGSTSYYAHLDQVKVKPGDVIREGSEIGTVGSTGKSTGAHVEFGLRDKNNQPIDPTMLFKPATAAQPQGTQVASLTSPEGLGLKGQGEVGVGRVREADKPFQEMRANITKFNPASITTSNANLEELNKIAIETPRIFQILKQSGEGVWSAVKVGAQEGVTAGRFGSVSLPIEKMAQAYNLTATESANLTRANQILGSEFLNNVSQNRGLLGINPTDNDARLLQAPMPTISDSSKSVQYWIRQQALLNEQRLGLFNAMDAHDKKVGAAAPPSAFFSSKDYTNILDSYSKNRRELEKTLAPYGSR